MPDQTAECVSEQSKHSTREIVEALQNLLFLMREDAENAFRVHAYVDAAERVLKNIHTNDCCCLSRR